MVATMSIAGGTDGDVFRSCVAQVLAPQLRPSQVVILDNLEAHKVAGIREAIPTTGAHLQYLSPSSGVEASNFSRFSPMPIDRHRDGEEDL